MNDNTKRLSRLTTILTMLQTKRIITASELAKKFTLSIRTIYRDIKALEAAGVPILTEEGKGYSLMEGYRLPPIMFSESEAYALITAEQFIQKNKDASFVKAFNEAMQKIKSVLRYEMKDKVNLLSNRIYFVQQNSNEYTSNLLSTLQMAIVHLKCAKIYYSNENGEKTKRIIEPFALYHTKENWILVAFCQLKKDYRSFRLDRVIDLEILPMEFIAHSITLEEYFQKCK